MSKISFFMSILITIICNMVVYVHLIVVCEASGMIKKMLVFKDGDDEDDREVECNEYVEKLNATSM